MNHDIKLFFIVKILWQESIKLNLKVKIKKKLEWPVKQCDLSSISPKAVIWEGIVWQGRLSSETLPVMLSQVTPLHSQQSEFGNHEESTSEGSVSRCLNLRRMLVSFSLQWTVKLHVTELNMMRHSEERKNNLKMERKEFMIMQDVFLRMWLTC